MKKFPIVFVGIFFFFGVFFFLGEKCAFAIVVDGPEYQAIPEDDDGVSRDTTIEVEEEDGEANPIVSLTDPPLPNRYADDVRPNGGILPPSPYASPEEWVLIDQLSTNENNQVRTITRNHDTEAEEQIEETKICILNNGTGQVRYSYQTIHCGRDNQIDGVVDSEGTTEFTVQRSTHQHSLDLWGTNAVGFLYARPADVQTQQTEINRVALNQGLEWGEAVFFPFEEGRVNQDSTLALIVENTGDESIRLELVNGSESFLDEVIPPHSTEKIHGVHVVSDEQCTLRLQRSQSFWNRLFGCCSGPSRAEGMVVLYKTDQENI